MSYKVELSQLLALLFSKYKSVLEAYSKRGLPYLLFQLVALFSIPILINNLYSKYKNKTRESIKSIIFNAILLGLFIASTIYLPLGLFTTRGFIISY